MRFGVAWRGYQGYSNPSDWGFRVKTSIYDGPYLSRSTEQGAMLAICAACSEAKAAAALRYTRMRSEMEAAGIDELIDDVNEELALWLNDNADDSL